MAGLGFDPNKNYTDAIKRNLAGNYSSAGMKNLLKAREAKIKALGKTNVLSNDDLLKSLYNSNTNYSNKIKGLINKKETGPNLDNALVSRGAKMYLENKNNVSPNREVMKEVGYTPTITGTNIPKPTYRTPFSEILPFGKVFDKNLVNQLAYDQVAPDVLRGKNEALTGLGRAMAASGAWRTGHLGKEIQGVEDRFSRELNERQAGFSGQVKNWLTDWYNRQANNYYQNPIAWDTPSLPGFEEYAQQKGIGTNPTVAPNSKLNSIQKQAWNPIGMLRDAYGKQSY